jgi:hypothetical protein
MKLHFRIFLDDLINAGGQMFLILRCELCPQNAVCIFTFVCNFDFLEGVTTLSKAICRVRRLACLNARQGKSSQGKATENKAGQGKSKQPKQGKARQSEARRDNARQSTERQGNEKQGKARQ